MLLTSCFIVLLINTCTLPLLFSVAIWNSDLRLPRSLEAVVGSPVTGGGINVCIKSSALDARGCVLVHYAHFIERGPYSSQFLLRLAPAGGGRYKY